MVEKLVLPHPITSVLIGADADLAFIGGTRFAEWMNDFAKGRTWQQVPIDTFHSSFSSRVNICWLTLHLFCGTSAAKVELIAEDHELFNNESYRQNARACVELYVWDATEVLLILDDVSEAPARCGPLKIIR